MGALLISVQQDLNTLGIKHLHQYLLANGQDSHLLFMPTAGRDGDRLHAGLARFIGETRPKLVALSLMSHELADATAVTRFIRGSFPGIPVVWGGIQPTSDPEACFDVVDHLCVGEGERTMLDLARAAEQGAPFDDIPNIARRVNGKCVQNDLYPLIEDLDTLPLLRRIPPESHVALRGGVAPLTDKLFRRYARQGAAPTT